MYRTFHRAFVKNVAKAKKKKKSSKRARKKVERKKRTSYWAQVIFRRELIKKKGRGN